MPSLFDKLLRRKEKPSAPKEVYRPPEQGEEVTTFGIGDVLEAAGEDQAGALAVADGNRNPLPTPFVVPDRTVGTVKGVDLEYIFVAFPIVVPKSTWKKVRGGTEWVTGDRLKATEDVPTDWGTIPKGHVVNVLEAVGPDQLRVSLMLQFKKADWWNKQIPDVRRWGSKQVGDSPARGSAEWLSLPISIEFFSGEERGPENRKCPYPYGYFNDILAMDGDSLDVILGPMWQDEDVPVWVAEQLMNGETHQYKPMLGFQSEDEARETFLQFWPEDMLGDLESCSPEEFHDAWLPELNETPEVRTAAGILDLQGYDEKLARDIAMAAVAEFGEDRGTREWAQRIADATPLRLGDIFPDDFLQTPKANLLFRNVRLFWYGDMSPKVKGQFIWHHNQGGIKLNATTIFGESASYNLAFHAILDVLSHEIRHAADWAYRGTEAFEAENPQTKQELGKITKEYVNLPTELKSWAGTVADKIIRDYGDTALDLGGTSLRNLINSIAPQYINLIAPESRQDFLSRVVKALEQRARLQ